MQEFEKTKADPLSAIEARDLTASSVQTFISELFRLQLCRNDDHNLAQSCLYKTMSTHTVGLVAQANKQAGAKSDHQSKTKIVSDIHVRESERCAREKEVTAQLNNAVASSLILDSPSLQKYFVRFVRKMLLLTIADNRQTLAKKHQFLLATLPSYMHLAQIMEEKTDLEKETFGKV